MNVKRAVPLCVLVLFLSVASLASTSSQAEGAESRVWVNRYSCDVLSEGLHATTSYIGPQVFWDGLGWRELNFEDHITEGYYLIENAHITAKIYEWYTVFYDPDNRRVCVDDERWVVEVYGEKTGKWREVDLYGPRLSYSNNETHLTVTRTFDCPEGMFSVTYLVWQGSFLKHDVVFKSKMAGQNQFRVTMKLAGIYSDKVTHRDGSEAIMGEKHVVSPYFFVGEDNSNLVLSEYLWSLGLVDEATGEWTPTTLKDVVFNTHASGSKCDIIIGDYSLSEGESLLIDPKTSTWQVGVLSDDCRVKDSDPAPHTTWDELDRTYLEHNIGYSDAYYYGAGDRFTNINIPQGATIHSAYLKVTSTTSTSADVNATIQGEDTDDASTFSNVGNYNGRTRTSASVDWNITAGWTVNVEYSSPDVKTVIQEITNRTGWSSGNALVLFFEDNNSTGIRSTYAYDLDSSRCDKLEVTWGMELRLHIFDSDGNAISGATAYANATTMTSNSNGWANFTIPNLNDVAHVKVELQEVTVNGTWTVTMDSDKTFNVSCTVYSLTVYVTDIHSEEKSGASMALSRDGTSLNGLYGLPSSPTASYHNDTHGKYVWSQLANQTSSYTVSASMGGQTASSTTALTSNTEVTIILPGGTQSPSYDGWYVEPWEEGEYVPIEPVIPEEVEEVLPWLAIALVGAIIAIPAISYKREKGKTRSQRIRRKKRRR